MEKDRKSGQNGKDGMRRKMNISPKEWDERWEKIFGKKQEQKDIKK